MCSLITRLYATINPNIRTKDGVHMAEKTLQMIIELIESSNKDEIIDIISQLNDYSQFEGLIKAISERMAAS